MIPKLPDIMILPLTEVPPRASDSCATWAWRRQQQLLPRIVGFEWTSPVVGGNTRNCTTETICNEGCVLHGKGQSMCITSVSLLFSVWVRGTLTPWSSLALVLHFRRMTVQN